MVLDAVFTARVPHVRYLIPHTLIVYGRLEQQ
jgi:hypothetical protein